MNHKELIGIAAKWLRKHPENIIIPNCSLILTEILTSNDNREIPDVIGFCSYKSVLLEVKTSRADFLRDKDKYCRILAEKGMGNLRYYFIPKGLIIYDSEIPSRWGILEWDGRRVIIKKKADHIDVWVDSERAILLSSIKMIKNEKKRGKK